MIVSNFNNIFHVPRSPRQFSLRFLSEYSIYLDAVWENGIRILEEKEGEQCQSKD